VQVDVGPAATRGCQLENVTVGATAETVVLGGYAVEITRRVHSQAAIRPAASIKAVKQFKLPTAVWMRLQDGRLMTTLKGDHIVAEFIKILDDYVDSHYAAKQQLAISN
jgi:hypothetical protein